MMKVECMKTFLLRASVEESAHRLRVDLVKTWAIIFKEHLYMVVRSLYLEN